jgi:hypothetical protein
MCIFHGYVFRVWRYFRRATEATELGLFSGWLRIENIPPIFSRGVRYPPCFGFGLGPLGAGRFGVSLFCQDGADDEEFWHELEGEVFGALASLEVFDIAGEGADFFCLGRLLACFGVFHVNGPRRWVRVARSSLDGVRGWGFCGGGGRASALSSGAVASSPAGGCCCGVSGVSGGVAFGFSGGGCWLSPR